MADLVAKTGKQSPYSTLRDFFMKYSTQYMKPLQQRIFKQTVSYSVGRNSTKLHWLPLITYFPQNMRQENCILSSIMGEKQFKKLSQVTRSFRSSFVGYGKGWVNVRVFPFASFVALSSDTVNKPFGAYIQSYFNKDGTSYQKWTRVFGEGQSSAVKYSTVHRSTPSIGISKTGLALTQSLGIGPDIIRFDYLPQIQGNTVRNISKGIWFRIYKLSIPRFFLPTSQWQENKLKMAGISMEKQAYLKYQMDSIL